MAGKKFDWENIPGFDRVKHEFVRLDLDKWLETHGILEEAGKQGYNEEPSAEGERPEGTAVKIESWVNRRGRVCRQNVNNYLEDLERELASKEDKEVLTILGQEVEELYQNADLALEQKFDEGNNDLLNREQELRNNQKDYRQFRGESDLRREPYYPNRESAIRYLLFFFIGELLLNASMLMEVNAFGLVGSMAQMGLIGLVNIFIMAWLMGSVLRYKNHKNTLKKRFSWLGILLVPPSVLAFNLIVGHFRDSMQAVVGDFSADIYSVGSDTFDRFLASPFGFDTFQSSLLALMGFLFFAVASWKWLDRDDHYPDYGRRHRQLEGKRQDYVKRFDYARNELQKSFENYQMRLEDIREKLKHKQTSYREKLLQGKNVVREYPTNLGQYQHDLNQLLAAYYDANRSTRNDSAPAWFAEQVSVDAEILKPPEFNPPNPTSIIDVTDKVSKAIGELQETYRQRMRALRSLQNVLDKRTEAGAQDEQS